MRRGLFGAAVTVAACCLLIPLILFSGCTFSFYTVETRQELEPVVERSSEDQVGPQGWTPEEVQYVLNLIKAIPIVELFTDKPIKDKVVEAAIAAGVPIKYTTTRKHGWFLFRTRE